MGIFEYLECGCSTTTWMLIAFISILAMWIGTRKAKNLPPGPPAYPVIGSFLSLAGPDVRVVFQKLRKQYGDVISLQLGNKTVIVFNGYDTLKEAFVKNGDVFNDRPRNLIYEEMTQGKGIINGSGEMWKEQRKFSLSVLRDLGFGKNVMENRVLEEIVFCMDAIGSYNGAPLDVHAILRASVCNIISSLTLGQRFHHDDPEFSNTVEVINKSLQIVGGTSVGHFLPFLKYCPGDPLQFQHLLRSNKITKGFMRKYVQLHYTDETMKHSEDFVNAYLKEIQRQQDAKVTDSSFNEDTLVAIVEEFFIAGMETITTTLRWALIYLALNPDVQEKAQKELDQVLGKDKLPSMADKVQMPYMEALVAEIQRISDVAPLSVPHANHKAASFRGYTIPAHSLILQNLSSVLLDPDMWEEPAAFRPERFLDENGHVLRMDAMIPFSLGKRTCLGESLARTELFLFVVCLLRRFTFRLPEGASPPDLRGHIGITRSPSPYDICAVERHCD